jgi:hypothetical protein
MKSYSFHSYPFQSNPWRHASSHVCTCEYVDVRMRFLDERERREKGERKERERREKGERKERERREKGERKGSMESMERLTLGRVPNS